MTAAMWNAAAGGFLAGFIFTLAFVTLIEVVECRQGYRRALRDTERFIRSLKEGA